jgi:hypothetical protein
MVGFDESFGEDTTSEMLVTTYQTVRCYKLEDLNFYCHMSKPIKDKWSQHYRVVPNSHVISCATRNTLGKRGRVLKNYFCKPTKKSGIRYVNIRLSRWISVKLCDLAKLAAFTAKELLFNCLNAVVPVAFYCDENGVYIRDAVKLVSLPWRNFIYTRDTVILVEMLILSSQNIPDRTSPQQTPVQCLNQGKSNLMLYLLYFCSRFDYALPTHHNLPQGTDQWLASPLFQPFQLHFRVSQYQISSRNIVNASQESLVMGQPHFCLQIYMLLHGLFRLGSIWGRAAAQAVSRRLPTMAARVRSCEICGGQSGTGVGFLRAFPSPLPIPILPIAPQSSTFWGWYNRPNSGRSTKWTLGGALFQRALLACLGEPLIGCVAMWKQHHLHYCFAQTRHKHSRKRNLEMLPYK